MPNWVANHLTIHGENAVEVLRSLLTERKEENEAGCCFDFDFNKIIPMPESLLIESGSRTNSCVEMYLTSINPFVDYYGENKVGADEFAKICSAVQATKVFVNYNDRLPLEEIRLREKETYYRNERNEQKIMTKDEILANGRKAVDNVLTYGAMDWYDWSCKNWGTKWDAVRTQIPDLEIAEVYFDTAWSPVPQLMLALAEKFPDCSIEYEYAEEQAGYYAGRLMFKGGEVIESEPYAEYSKESYEMFFRLWGFEDEYRFNDEAGTYEQIEDEEVM